MRFQRSRRAKIARRPAPRRTRSLGRRMGTLETLEKREMLAGDAASAWHNAINPSDVNFDQRVTVSDLLMVVNDLLRDGPRALTVDEATPLTSSSSTPHYVDVNNDGRVSTSDLLMVVNALLATENMTFTTIVTDMADNPITQVTVGSQYKLTTIVQDVAGPQDQYPNRTGGVFSAGTTVGFNSLSTIDTNQTLGWGSSFVNGRESTLQQGSINAWAFANPFDNPPGTDPQLLFSVVLTATTAGTQIFTPVFDTNPNHPNGLYQFGDDGLPPQDTVAFTGTTLEILPLDFSIGDVSQVEGDSGTSTFNFTVSLSEASATQATVQYATSNGTATSGSDYLAASGTLTFAPGQTTAVIPITVAGDNLFEADETFNVVLSNPSGASIGDGTGVGTILNDDTEVGFSIGDVTQAEGDTNSTFNFTVSLSQPASDSATVQFATADGTAIAGSDYQATSGTLTFSPGQTTAVIAVTVIGDGHFEQDENFSVVLSNPSDNASIGDGTAVGTITNDDAQGAFSIVGSTVDNVQAGTTIANFTVSLSQALKVPVTVQYSTANSTAIAGLDYEATSGTLTFNPGESLTQTVPVTIIGDNTPDNIDKFFVNLGNPSAPDATIAVSQATIQINPAVVGITATITPSVTAAEGNSGEMTPFVFTVSLTSAATQTSTVAYSTDPITATANVDYQSTSGTLTFSPGTTTQLVTVQVLGDNVSEPSETFALKFEGIIGVTNSGQGIGTIVDDDGTPTLTITDATVTAGGGVTQAQFTVTLSGAVSQAVTVGYATSNNTAIAGQDYLTTTGNLLFTPGGEVTKVITVPILGASAAAPDKTFFVNLSSVTGGAVIGDDLGVGTIVTQGISISDTVIVEGQSGERDAVVTVSLSREFDDDVTVAYATIDGTATTADSDYVATSGTLTFAAGTTTQTVTVKVKGDTVQEANETFQIVLSDASGATVFNNTGTVTILNDDGQSVAYLLSLTDENGTPLPFSTQFDVGDEFYLNVSVQDVRLDPTGVAQAFIDILYNDSVLDVLPGTLEFGSFYNQLNSFDFETGLLNDFGGFGSIDGQPPSPGDPLLLYRVAFVATDVGLATFTGSVADADIEDGHKTLVYFAGPDESVPPEQINIEPTGFSINIGANVITVADASANESAQQVVFTVTRFLPTNETATVVYSTVDGTALAGQDYTAKSGTLTFDAANPVRFVTVTVNDDLIDEPNETFSLVLTSPVNATVSDNSAATGTIIDNDSPVSVSVSGGSADEGSNLVFNVNLSSVSGKTVTVAYATTGSGTATAGLDYTPVSGTLTFLPGVTSQSVTVATLGDILLEGNETFQLSLLPNQTNATLGTATASGTIIDIPPAGISGYVYVDLNNNGLKDANETGIQGATVTAKNNLTGVTKSTTTNADGSYTLVGLIPGSYTLIETQPGFYTDGRDTRFGVDSPINDQFVGIDLAPSEGETGYNFGELGIRGEFISAFLNRRALFASAVVGGFSPNVNLSGTMLDLRTGDLWVSFDGGWSGLRQIDALFNSAQGTATMKLYNYDLQEVAISAPTATGASLLYNGTLGHTYFLKITGTNANVTVQLNEATPASNLTSTTGQSTGSSSSSGNTNTSTGSSGSGTTTTYVYNRFGQLVPVTTPAAEPLVGAEDSADDAFAEDEDWVLESLLA